MCVMYFVDIISSHIKHILEQKRQKRKPFVLSVLKDMKLALIEQRDWEKLINLIIPYIKQAVLVYQFVCSFTAIIF